MVDVNDSSPGVPGRRAAGAPDDSPATEPVVLGDDSRLREVRGTRDARAADLAHARGDTVQRPAIRPQPRGPVDEDDEDGLIGGFRGTESSPRRERRARRREQRSEVDLDRGGDRDRGREDEGDDALLDDQQDGGDPQKPVGEALAGFFVGMAYVLVLPVLWWVLSDPDSPADLVSADLVFFLPAILVPIGLAVAPRTRRFGRYMLLGVGLSAVVVVGVAALVLAYLIFAGR